MKLALAAALALVALGQIPSARAGGLQGAPENLPVFEVASIRPVRDAPAGAPPRTRELPGGRLEVVDARLVDIITWAYALDWSQRVIGSQEVLQRKFSILAKPAGEVLSNRADPKSPVKLMTQALLRDRFGLRVAWKDELQDVFVVKRISATTLGRRMIPLKGPCRDVVEQLPPVIQNGKPVPRRCGASVIGGHFLAAVDRLSLAFAAFQSVTTARLSGGRDHGIRFVDETGLTGGFDMMTSFDVSTLNPTREREGDPALPSFTDALRDDFGLRTERQKRGIPQLVVESVSAPTAN